MSGTKKLPGIEATRVPAAQLDYLKAKYLDSDDVDAILASNQALVTQKKRKQKKKQKASDAVGTTVIDTEAESTVQSKYSFDSEEQRKRHERRIRVLASRGAAIAEEDDDETYDNDNSCSTIDPEEKKMDEGVEVPCNPETKKTVWVQVGSDNDDLPRRRRERHDSDNDDIPRRRERHDSDNDDLPRRRRERHDSDNDDLPRRRERHDSDNDDTPPEKVFKKEERHSHHHHSHSHDKERERMESGMYAGLTDHNSVRSQTAELKRAEAEKFRGIDPTALGKGAETVYRDRRGRRLEGLEEFVRQQEKKVKAKEEENMEWGRGLVQKAEAISLEERLREEESRPFATYENDPERDRMLREKNMWGDPMAGLIQKDPREAIAAGRPRYRGPPPPPNRFNIQPDYLWDGVDRSNGFEKRYFETQSKNENKKQEDYMWRTQDM